MNLRKALFVLPNLFTLSSIFCGFYATLICASGSPGQDDFYRAALLIVFAMFFDTIDGRVARLTKTQSAFGVQIDSLADVVSFGVAPGVLLYRWSLDSLGWIGAAVCFAYCACGVIRLARFNVLATTTDGAPKKPSEWILGLPIPGAAGILVSLVVANHAVAGSLPGSPLLLLIVVIGLSFLMVSTIKFRSFKNLKLGWRAIALVAFALGSSAVVALRYHLAFALVWLLACYVAIALIETVWRFTHQSVTARRDRSRGRQADREPEPEEAKEKS